MTKYLSPESPSATPSMVERMILGERIQMHDHTTDRLTARFALCGVIGPCEVCGKTGTCQPDPYDLDVENEVNYHYLCQACADQIADDI